MIEYPLLTCQCQLIKEMLLELAVNLIFTGILRDDTGVYECSVSNLLDDVTGNVSLTVQCRF